MHRRKLTRILVHAVVFALVASLTGCAGLTNQPPSMRPTANQEKSFLKRAQTEIAVGDELVVEGVQTVYGTTYQDMGIPFLTPDPKVYQFAATMSVPGAPASFVILYRSDATTFDVVDNIRPLDADVQDALRAYSKVTKTPAVDVQQVHPSDIRGMPDGVAVWQFTQFDPDASSDAFWGRRVLLLEQREGEYRRLPLSYWP